MEVTDQLNPKENLVVGEFDGSNNMLGSKTSVGVRLKTLYHLFMENHCFSCSGSLTCKGIYNKIDCMDVFQNIIFEY